MSSVGIAPQFTGTNGPSRRGPDSWMSFATNSLPVPDSPKMCTGAWLRATRAIISRICCMALDVAEQARTEHAGVGIVGVGQLDCSGDQLAQSRQIEGFGDEIEGAQFERAHGRLHVAMRGEHATGTLGEYC